MLSYTPCISSLTVIMSIKNAILLAEEEDRSRVIEIAGIFLSVGPESDISERVAFWEQQYEGNKK